MIINGTRFQLPCAKQLSAVPRISSLVRSPINSTRPRQAVLAAASKGFGAPPKTKKAAVTPAEPPTPCPCQSGKAYKNCCEPAHTGTKVPATPEAALRARFSAFKNGQEQFVSDTTHPEYLAFHYENKSAEEAREQYTKDIHAGCQFDYQSLKITKAEQGANEDEWFVAFSYSSSPKQAPGDEQERAWKTTSEKARFLRVDGTWKFADYQRFEYNLDSLMQSKPEPVK